MKFCRLGALVLALTAAIPAAAEKKTRGAKPEEKKPNPCAAYGPGFTMLPGTTTCVRIGGAVEGDLSVGRGAAPNLGVK
ncbi:MAG TPA: porin [Rhodoblastus sp.]|nr:porin [Rhodoblastus sp.]